MLVFLVVFDVSCLCCKVFMVEEWSYGGFFGVLKWSGICFIGV